ncbi:hypothetical protein TNCV_4528291 [Trichonephila clavipes]|nr:hypothetical protein TNCV_4528291 [Trichonephila clavipes]
MIALMRQQMRERNRVIGLMGRTRKTPDILENPLGNENKSGKSDKGYAGWKDLRVKRDRVDGYIRKVRWKEAKNKQEEIM